MNLFHLGHLSKDQIKPMHEKISKLHKFKKPVNIKKIQAFVGLAVYYKLFGKDHIIFTGHMPLKYIFKADKLSARLTRWIIDLDPYMFTVEYRKGIKHMNV